MQKMRMKRQFNYNFGSLCVALLTEKGEKDIVFLDIEMPGMNGIYVGNELKKANRNVIVFVVTGILSVMEL